MLFKIPFTQCSQWSSHLPMKKLLQHRPLVHLARRLSQPAQSLLACLQCASCPLKIKPRPHLTPRHPILLLNPSSQAIRIKIPSRMEVSKLTMWRLARIQVSWLASRTHLASCLSQHPTRGSKGLIESLTLVSSIIQARHKRRIRSAS